MSIRLTRKNLCPQKCKIFEIIYRQPMTEDELETLRERLQTKLDNLSHVYQAKAHKRFFNSEWETKRYYI